MLDGGGLATSGFDYIRKLALLVLLYVLTGKLGLLLAVPPGYATIIWPPSGIAMGLLLVHGWRLWPGVLVGSFLLNGAVSGVWSPGHDFALSKALISLCIALGSSAQALTAFFLIRRYAGLPLRLDHVRQLLRLFLLAGPVSCVIAASVGVTALLASGAVGLSDLPANWLAWWAGDFFGVIVFLPLMLVTRGATRLLVWRDAPIRGLPFVAMLVLVVPLGLTFYAWKISSESHFRQTRAEFQSLADENEQALTYRLGAYRSALMGGAGFLRAAGPVTRSGWRNYVQTLQLPQNFPGIGGMGLIESVPTADLPDFLRRARADDSPDFTIHPSLEGVPHNIIRYVEPEAANRPALGLNISFEANRLSAAELARDTGSAAITRRISLVQDEARGAGFLLLYPLYRDGMQLQTTAQRRDALRGWIYAPIVARDFLKDLTRSQNKDLDLTVYDAADEPSRALIFSSRSNEAAVRPEFTLTRNLEILHQHWRVEWTSTPDFEVNNRSQGPLLILVGGLLFTGLFGLFLMVLTVNRTETMEWLVGERQFALSSLIFAVLAVGSCLLYLTLRRQESAFAGRLVRAEASKLGSLLAQQNDSAIQAIGRMGRRWEMDGGTALPQWQDDAKSYLANLPGLTQLSWLDAASTLKWIEGRETGGPLQEGRKIPAALLGWLNEARGRAGVTVTSPMSLATGGTPVFIAFQPLTAHGHPDGFILATFSVAEFAAAAFGKDAAEDMSVRLEFAGRTYYQRGSIGPSAIGQLATHTDLLLQDRSWQLSVVPSARFIEHQHSWLPLSALISGVLIAILSALSVRYILIARLKSEYLLKSSQLNAAILSSSAHLVIATDSRGGVSTFNRAAEVALGYEAREVVGVETPALWHDPAEVQARARTLSAELGEPVEPGFEVFTRKPLRDGVESREWTFIRRDNTRFPANLTVTTLRDRDGAVSGFLGVIEDITERKNVDRMKSEFVAIVSHELRTPLTSIRGSLGLVLGAFNQNMSDQARRLLGIAHTNSERLSALIDDILNLESLASGRFSLKLADESLELITRQAVQANVGYAERFGVSITADPIDPDLRVRVDSERYLQVLANLLSNAAKFSAAGSSIQVCARSEGDRVRISVADQGSGVPEEFRSRIFGKFSQADASAARARGGTGLGLYIARELIESMHGSIGFDSGPHGGSVFWIELPLLTMQTSNTTALPLLRGR